MPLLVVPDTNVYVHFKPFDDIPWADVVGENDVVFIVLAPVVRELDKLKMEPRLRDRVRGVLPRIDALFADSDSATLRTGIRTRFEHGRGAAAVMSEHSLEPSLGDDRIIAAALALQKGPDPVVLVTDDTGMRLRARALGLTVRPMPEGLRLLSSDPLAAENAKLRREVDELRTALPLLTVSFLEGGSVLKTLREPPPKKRGLRFSDIFPRPLSKDTLPAIYEFERTKPTEQEMAEYNKKLEHFRPTHEKYLREREDFELFPFVSLALEMLVSNAGGRPADTLRLVFDLPSGARLVRKKDIPREPPKPVPPQLPGRPRATVDDDESRNTYPGSFLFNPQPPPALKVPGPPPNVVGPFAEGNEKVVFEIRVLSNFDEVVLPRVLLRFPSPADVPSFQLPYSLRSHSLPKLVTGALHVVVNSGGSDADDGASPAASE